MIVKVVFNLPVGGGNPGTTPSKFKRSMKKKHRPEGENS